MSWTGLSRPRRRPHPIRYRQEILDTGEQHPRAQIARARDLPTHWAELRTDYNTTVAQVTQWRATVKVVNDNPTDRDPLGLYITTLDWAQEQSE